METQLKTEMYKQLLLNSKDLFEAIADPSVPKESQCCISKHFGMCTKPIVLFPLKLNHLVKHVIWALQYMKLDLQKRLGTDQCRELTVVKMGGA